MSDLIHVIREAWNWIGIDPEEVIAENRPHLDAINETQDFRRDWWMKPMVDEAAQLLGPLGEGRKYCLKMPAVLGGSYDSSNFGTLSLLILVVVV